MPITPPRIFTRRIPPLHYETPPPQSGRCEAVVTVLGELAPGDGGAYIVEISFAGLRSSVQTTRAGVEAMRDACNLALLVEP